MNKQNNYYQILEISQDATIDEIKTAYRLLALEFHPDKHLDSEANEKATQLFQLINEAYDTLGNPQKKLEYDLQLTSSLNYRQRELTVSLDGFGDFTNIQDAINSSSPGDIITIFPGEYFEDLFINKEIEIKSVDGSVDQTIISILLNGIKIDTTNVTISNITFFSDKYCNSVITLINGKLCANSLKINSVSTGISIINDSQCEIFSSSLECRDKFQNPVVISRHNAFLKIENSIIRGSKVGVLINSKKTSLINSCILSQSNISIGLKENSRVQIINCNIFNVYTAVSLSPYSSLVFEGNTIRDHLSAAIIVSNNCNVNIINNSFSLKSKENVAMYFKKFNNCLIDNNKFIGYEVVGLFEDKSNIQITNNLINGLKLNFEDKFLIIENN